MIIPVVPLFIGFMAPNNLYNKTDSFCNQYRFFLFLTPTCVLSHYQVTRFSGVLSLI